MDLASFQYSVPMRVEESKGRRVKEFDNGRTRGSAPRVGVIPLGRVPVPRPSRLSFSFPSLKGKLGLLPRGALQYTDEPFGKFRDRCDP